MEQMSKDLAKQVLSNNPDLKEIVIRTGEAPKSLNSTEVKINGNIDAVSRFIEYREGKFEKDNSHCLVSKSQGIISFVTNEHFPCESISVTGRIEISKIYKSLGINNSECAYHPEKLSKKLKLLRSIFQKPADHMNIVASLKNLKAKVNQELNKNNDNRGNVKVDFNQTVEANIPDSFIINIPLIEGEDPIRINVEVILEANSSHEILCYLESIDAAESIDIEREKRVMEEVEKIEDKTTIIFV